MARFEGAPGLIGNGKTVIASIILTLDLPDIAKEMTATEINTGAPAAVPFKGTEAEIAILEALQEEGESITAQFGSAKIIFRTTLRFVDPARQYIVVDKSADSSSNATLLAQSLATFVTELDEWRIEFTATAPQQTVHDGKDAIRLRFPESVFSRRRRMQARAQMDNPSEIRCVTYEAGVPVFEGTIFDISQGGVGVLQVGTHPPLVPGTVIRNCCIERVGKETVTVNLEVRHTEAVKLPNGDRAYRAGCRFVNWSPASMALIAELVKK